MEENGQIHAPAASPLGKNSGTYCIGDWAEPSRVGVIAFRIVLDDRRTATFRYSL
jgi:hypothetical protein